MEDAALIGSARLFEDTFWDKVKDDLPGLCLFGLYEKTKTLVPVRNQRLLLFLPYSPASAGRLLAVYGRNRHARNDNARWTERAQAIPDKVNFNFHVKPSFPTGASNATSRMRKVREGGLARTTKNWYSPPFGDDKSR